MKQRGWIALLPWLPVALLITATPAAARQAPTDAWEVVVAPYLMGSGITGTVGALGQEANIDASASEVFSHLEVGFMGMVRALKGNWGFGADAIFAGLGATVDQPPADIDSNETLLGFYGLRRLGPHVLATFGLRVNGVDNGISFKTPPLRAVSADQWWVDPVVGVHLRSSAARRVQARVYTEIGGFGVGSDVAWQVFPTVGIKVSERGSLELGYRWLGTDYETSELGERFVWDVVMQGPVFGWVMRF
jgi:hypothetical protein